MNNRILMLVPHLFHDSLMEKVLTAKLEESQKDNFKGFKGTAFDPSIML